MYFRGRPKGFQFALLKIASRADVREIIFDPMIGSGGFSFGASRGVGFDFVVPLLTIKGTGLAADTLAKRPKISSRGPKA
jgi:hypothetical protein